MIKFSELSIPCKIGIIGGWVALIFSGLSFIAGFIAGVLGI